MSTISNLIFKGAKHYVTSAFGNRKDPITGKAGSFHSGTDYGTDGLKIPQYAIEDGYVFAAEHSNSDGANYVWVIYPRVKLAMLHYHLDSYKVKSGQTVVKGTLLGYTGSTGRSTGVHLHLGIRNLSKLTAAQVNKMTWDNLRKCEYVNPETVAYTEPTAAAPKVEEPKPATPTTSQTTYTVVKGDTLSGIAKKFGIKLDDILKANPNIKNANLIHVGDVIAIPSAKTVASQPKGKATTKGAELKLTNEPLYASAFIDKVSNKVTGTYYVYDGNVVNGRMRITNSKANVGRFPLTKYVTGFINV